MGSGQQSLGATRIWLSFHWGFWTKEGQDLTPVLIGPLGLPC